MFLPASRAITASLGQATRSSFRSYTTGAGKSSSNSNVPLALSLGGLGGLAAWYSLGGFEPNKRPAAPVATTAPVADSTSTSAVTGTALDKDAFVEFKLKEIKPYNHDSDTYVFELPDGKKAGMTVASVLLLKAAGDSLKDDKGNPIVRPYTPISSPDTIGHLDFLIKRYPGGKMGNHVHNLKAGESIAIKGPISKWAYKANEFEHIGLIAGGTGITPMWQLAQQIASDPSDKTKVTLIYSNKTEQDILMREEWDRLAKDPRFTIIYGLDKKPDTFDGFQGYVTPSILSKSLPLPSLAEKAKVFVCGPPPQVAAVCGPKGPKGAQGELKGLLAELGYQPEQVYKF